ncbi:dTDP-4-dehydrorhamnose reductase [Bacillus sp. CH30_1T]|uniref:dTDP-4-dehydrorhamnose reductase n=1 Tax=Bacillus sp. CH30_1T TaxID=2604836 RepID=UPI0011ECF608|nr:dTDP-4-dehydrorhamnose reductase [Bacillus sp. CH30_1T]KAA0560842.1 dTDP-4-dehydrorhamnose reductase [Bacillus sp. CH30_1T]
MKILVTGYTGQLGYDVVKEGQFHGYDIYGVGSADLDITNKQRVTEFVEKLNPDAIVHSAAYTAVDQAEDDQDTCWNINVNGTRYLAEAAKSVGAKFMYISTDYVFDGEENWPLSETDSTSPVGYYGLTKLEGEKVVQSLLNQMFIVRISWVFGINGNNFVKVMLRLAETRSELNVVGDQFGSPTYTFDLARLLIEMIESEKYGIYHVSNEGFCSWAEFAREIFKVAGKAVKVHAINTEEYPTRAVRPKNSRLSKQKLVDSGFKPLPSWQEALEHYINELILEVNHD